MRLVLGLAHIPPRVKVRAVHFVLSYASRHWLEEDRLTIVPEVFESHEESHQLHSWDFRMLQCEQLRRSHQGVQ